MFRIMLHVLNGLEFSIILDLDPVATCLPEDDGLALEVNKLERGSDELAELRKIKTFFRHNLLGIASEQLF
jgi:hypothetical protein